MQLDYLDFDYSEDEHGSACWDAMACPPAARLPALCHEVAQLLAWAQRQFGNGPGPLDEGCDWDYDLQAHTEDGAPLACHYGHTQDQAALVLAPAPAGQRVQLTLALCGSPAFAQAFTDLFQS